MENINEISQYIQNFFDTYNHPTNISHILILKEQLIKIIRKNKTFKISNKINNINETFYIIKVVDDITTSMFISYSIFYFLDNLHSKKKLTIGLDFEFNKNKIALCQIGFFPMRKFKYIFVLDPKFLSDYQKNIMIKTIFISNMHRITHGADSLDIPYIFEELFLHDSEKIINFTKTMIDTRFLCEYYKIFINHTDKKCSLYDALLYFKVITTNKYDELNNITTIIGHIQYVNWDIYKMNIHHLQYAAYDVIYLKKFLNNILKLILHQHVKYIYEIDRFTYYEKYKISNILLNSKQITDKLNNYIVESLDHKTKTMIDIYNEVIEKVYIQSITMKISKLLEINNFKKSLTLLFKIIIYTIIVENYDVYINKKYKFTDKLSYNDIIEQLTKLKLHKLTILLEHFYDSAKEIIINLFQ